MNPLITRAQRIDQFIAQIARLNREGEIVSGNGFYGMKFPEDDAEVLDALVKEAREIEGLIDAEARETALDAQFEAANAEAETIADDTPAAPLADASLLAAPDPALDKLVDREIDAQRIDSYHTTSHRMRYGDERPGLGGLPRPGAFWLALLLPLLGVGCNEGPTPPEVASITHAEQGAAGDSERVYTLVHDRHVFVVASKVRAISIIHHPDCKCGKEIAP